MDAVHSRSFCDSVKTKIPSRLLPKVPEYSVGIRQKYYLEVMNVLEELEDFATIPRVLLTPTLFRLTYPYSKELAFRTVLNRASGGVVPTVKTKFDELIEIDRDFDELILFREDLGVSEEYCLRGHFCAGSTHGLLTFVR